MQKTLIKSVLGLSMIFVTFSAAPAHAFEFLEGFAASALVSTGFDVTSDGSNEKRAQLEGLQLDAAEYVVGGVPTQNLQIVMNEMKTEIKAKQPDTDLTQIKDEDLIDAIFKASTMAEIKAMN